MPEIDARLELSQMQIAILGLGNELLGDEGVGVHAARRLIQEGVPEGTSVVEVGTAILDALPIMEEADGLIVLDAMQHGKAPGTVYKIPLEDCSGSNCIASMHGFDIYRVLALVGREKVPPVLVFGVEPEHLSWSMELSQQVENSMLHLIKAVREEVEKMKGENQNR